MKFVSNSRDGCRDDGLYRRVSLELCDAMSGCEGNVALMEIHGGVERTMSSET